MDTFLSTPSARRATPPAAAPVSSMSDFYPRPPRGGRPLRPAPQPAYRSHFYPRPPRGGRQRGGAVLRLGDKFLSTPSARRATADHLMCAAIFMDFYPRPPRGGRRYYWIKLKDSFIFLSTPSARRATLELKGEGYFVYISIHALREEGDAASRLCGVPAIEFLSTPSARRATAKTETKSLFSNKLYNILHEFRRALIYNGSKSYPNHAK